MEDLEYRWDLERILQEVSIEDLTAEYFEKLKELVNLYKDDVFRSKERLLYFHQVSLNCTALGNRVFNYLYNKYQENLSDQEAFEKLQQLKCDAVHYHQQLSDFSNNAIENKDVIEEYLEDPSFKHLHRYYHRIFRTSGHQLPGQINKFMAAYSPLNSSYENIFSVLKDKNMPLKPVKNKDRKFIKIHNYEEFINTQYHEDRVFRKNAYYSWHDAIRKLEDTFAQLIYFKLLEQNIDAIKCNFPDGFYESRIFEDELPPSFIPYIYRKTARLSMEYKKFKKIRKQKIRDVYDLKGVKPWDLRMPIVKNTGLEKITIKEAQEMALEALAVLGEDYVTNLKRAFDEKWIDWKGRPGKTNGAYCISGCYGVSSKYILMNYSGRLDDVSTLVHELGHAMHALEYCKYQQEYADSSIFIAEIPSSLNELLLNFHLVEKYKNEPKKRLAVWDYLINNFFGATINQIILSDWEYSMNKLVNSGRVINAEVAKMVYKSKQQRYQGNRITKPLSAWKDVALCNILTVPHFYSGEFYVYKYAIGKIVGLMIAMELKQNPEYINKYFEFLRSGSSKSNLETLKILGIDLERSNIWTKLKNEVGRWISEYTKLANEII